MKKYLLLLVLIPIYHFTWGQTVSSFVINSTGGSFKNGNISLDYSVGEMAVTEIGGAGYVIQQGFLQADVLMITGIEEEISRQIIFFPNPVKDRLTIHSPLRKIAMVQMYDLAGKELTQKPLQEDVLDLSSFQSGVYLLSLIDENGKKLRMVRVVKH
jgi:hypothetical protein